MTPYALAMLTKVWVAMLAGGLIVVSAVAAVAAEDTSSGGQLSEESRLRMDGIGPVRVGMTPDEASKAAGQKITVAGESEGCGHGTVESGPKGLSFMVLRDKAAGPWKIARVEIDDASKIATEAGIAIGASEDDVKKAYSGSNGKLSTEPHKYDPNGHYMTYDTDGDGGLLLLFETEAAKVTRFRSGNEEAVNFVEGCS